MPSYPLSIGAARARKYYGVEVTGVPLPPAPPVNTVPPNIVLTGTGIAGDTLTASNGTWDNPGAYTRRWQRNNTNIAGALGTANPYVIIAADIGQSLHCNVTSTNSDGAATAASNAIQL